MNNTKTKQTVLTVNEHALNALATEVWNAQYQVKEWVTMHKWSPMGDVTLVQREDATEHEKMFNRDWTVMVGEYALTMDDFGIVRMQMCDWSGQTMMLSVGVMGLYAIADK